MLFFSCLRLVVGCGSAVLGSRGFGAQPVATAGMMILLAVGCCGCYGVFHAP